MLSKKDIKRPGKAIVRFAQIFSMFENRGIKFETDTDGSNARLKREGEDYPLAEMNLQLSVNTKDIKVALRLSLQNYIAAQAGLLLGSDYTSPASIVELTISYDEHNEIRLSADDYADNDWHADGGSRSGHEHPIFERMLPVFWYDKESRSLEMEIPEHEECRILAAIDHCAALLAEYTNS